MGLCGHHKLGSLGFRSYHTYSSRQLLLCCLILVVSITSCKFVLRLDVMIEDLGFDFIVTMSALVTTTLCVIVIPVDI